MSRLRLLLLLPAAIIALSGPAGRAADCVQCGKRVIVCYEIQVWAKRPANYTDKQWQGLGDAAVGYYKQLLLTSADCFSFLWAGRLIGPSAGGTSNYDYEIYGDLIGTDGDYRIELSLVTGKTRELVAHGSSRFARPEEAGQSGGFAALNLGSTEKGSVPLRDVVDRFERRKREENPKVALGARLSFEKFEPRMRIDNEQEIQVKLVDCDDYKLKGRKIQFQASAGRVTAEAVADENGIARIKYRAPEKPAEVQLTAFFEYDYPSEKYGQAKDVLSIKVERDPFFDAEAYRGQIAMGVQSILTDDHQCDVDCILIAAIDEQASIDCTLGGRYEEKDDVEARWINEGGGATGRASVRDHTDLKNDSGEIFDFMEFIGSGTSKLQRGAVRLVVNRVKGTYSLYFPPVEITVKESFGSQGPRDNPHYAPGNYHGAFAIENLPLPKSGNTLSGSCIIKREIEYPNGYSCNPEMEVTVNWSLIVVK